MERTGHQSLEGVHSYKRTSEMQKESLSNNTLNGCTSSTTALPHQNTHAENVTGC